MSDRRLIIVLDGPAGSGKSSTAKAVAAELGYQHLDSGAFYRAVTLAALDRGIPADTWQDLSLDQLDELDVHARVTAGAYRLTIGDAEVGDRIRSAEVNEHVSRMAAVPAVREWLLGAQREAGSEGGLVADGRDMGTVVFPDADLKVFLVCEPAERARRRLVQEGAKEPTEDEIAAEVERLLERDRRDTTRAVAPLAQAPDAVLLDTTNLDFTAQVEAIVHLARDRSNPPDSAAVHNSSGA